MLEKKFSCYVYLRIMRVRMILILRIIKGYLVRFYGLFNVNYDTGYLCNHNYEALSYFAFLTLMTTTANMTLLH